MQVGAIVTPQQTAGPSWCAGPAGLPGAWCGAGGVLAVANRSALHPSADEQACGWQYMHVRLQQQQCYQACGHNLYRSEHSSSTSKLVDTMCTCQNTAAAAAAAAAKLTIEMQET